jgi:DNA-binding response OmpR family regulator
MIRAFCHNCGADIVRDQPIVLNDFTMIGEHHPLFFGGAEIKLTAMERAVAWSLLKAFPDVVRTAAMLARMGFDGDCDHVVTVVVSKIKAKLRAAGVVGEHIVNVRGIGYRWHIPGYEHALVQS